MGKIVSKLQEKILEIHLSSARLLMVGLDSAGKTTILYKIKLDQDDVQTLPTVGFNVETVTVCKNVTFTVWDVGGQEKLRRLWNMYFKGSHGILFVVDSSDKERLPVARVELMRMCKAEELKGIPLIVMANKQDVEGALSTSEIADWLNLGKMKDRYWCVQGTCATRGEGLLEKHDDHGDFGKNYKKSSHKLKRSNYL
ncbi:LOW QUALITY PROTEIN: ADP-ribosylation factor 1-like [Liolophura sinensis]|uniref:LOW QUALITY PROTEIN: ADP-ribosylation factor 1-like n=1 Tax=Liolophura sinensis TaxID=3198878 RepID=UPI0031582869